MKIIELHIAMSYRDDKFSVILLVLII